MKKYMVIVQTDEGEVRWYYDDLAKADNARMDSECGMGWYAEVWQLVDGNYEFMYC